MAKWSAAGRARRLAVEYVLPLRWSDDAELDELTDYLGRLAGWVDVTVVDGSPDELWHRHAERWQGLLRHLRPGAWPGRNGKVAGVVTGVLDARHEYVVIADDDVRYDLAGLAAVTSLLADADLVRPQNFFEPMPWHARWDTARSLLNRALGSDYPGTYAVRRSTFVAMGGYDGDVLFENLELSRTVRANGGREAHAKAVFVVRRPPSTHHFLRQRVRQAYDDLAQPPRLVTEAAILPVLVLLVRGSLSSQGSTRRRSGWGLVAGLLVPVVLAEWGRRTCGARTRYPATSALWAPAWLTERGICIWVAIGYRVAGGVPYAGQRLSVAAHSVAELRRRQSSRTAGRAPSSAEQVCRPGAGGDAPEPASV